MRGPGWQNFKPRPLVNGNAFVKTDGENEEIIMDNWQKQSISRRAAKKLA